MTTVSKARSLGLVTVAYSIAIAVAAAWLTWGPRTGQLWLDTLIADVLATLVVFVFSRAYRNSSFYDAYWSVVPPLLLFYWWSRAAPAVDALRCWLLAIVVVLWAVRLTANWVYAFPGLHHEDWRYPMFKQRAGRWEILADLSAIHLIPTLQVFLGMVPAYVAVTRPGPGWVWLSWVGFVVGIAAVALEFIADLQMHRFVAQRDLPSTPWLFVAGEARSATPGLSRPDRTGGVAGCAPPSSGYSRPGASPASRPIPGSATTSHQVPRRYRITRPLPRN
jgi:hypothetical protein